MLRKMGTKRLKKINSFFIMILLVSVGLTSFIVNANMLEISSTSIIDSVQGELINITNEYACFSNLTVDSIGNTYGHELVNLTDGWFSGANMTLAGSVKNASGGVVLNLSGDYLHVDNISVSSNITIGLRNMTNNSDTIKFLSKFWNGDQGVFFYSSCTPGSNPLTRFYGAVGASRAFGGVKVEDDGSFSIYAQEGENIILKPSMGDCSGSYVVIEDVLLIEGRTTDPPVYVENLIWKNETTCKYCTYINGHVKSFNMSTDK